MAHLAFIFCCAVWGTTFILLERVTHVMGPVEIGIWRMFMGAAVVGVCWWLNRGEYRMCRRDFAGIVGSAILFTAPPQVIQAYVLAQGFGHSFFGTMVAAIPLLTILVSIPMLKLLPTRRELFGVLGGLVCIFMLLEDGVHRGMTLPLLGLTLLIPLSSALSNTYQKWQLPHVPASVYTTITLMASGLVLLPVQMSPGAVASLAVATQASAKMSSETITFLILLGVIGSGFSTLAFNWLVVERGPLFAGMTTYVVPVLALAWGRMDHESISGLQMIAMVGALAMVALVQIGATQPERELAVVTPGGGVIPLADRNVCSTELAATTAAEFLADQSGTRVA
ncbi:MAG TPA: DMT family transporter [Lacipirellulaceae bacterium]|nr:DMT family transporter [Lacipirellulaceae bacterium]